MIQAFIDLLGSYVPNSYQVWNDTLQDYETIIPSGAAGVDWSYVLAAVFVIVLVYSFTRMIGGIFRR